MTKNPRKPASFLWTSSSSRGYLKKASKSLPLEERLKLEGFKRSLSSREGGHLRRSQNSNEFKGRGITPQPKTSGNPIPGSGSRSGNESSQTLSSNQEEKGGDPDDR